jgi:RNA polymerase sigma-70 factor (ECF subfamily)
LERSDPPDRTDEELVARCRQNDVRAFDELLSRHERKILRVLRLLGIPQTDREDVAQEVFIRVFKHLSGYRPGKSFSGWVYRITVNAAHDHQTKAGRRGSREVTWDEHREDSPDARPGPGEILAERENMGKLESAVLSLSERERAVFVLCELEGLSTKEVAQSLRITTITVRRHMARARSRLQLILEEKK